MSYSRVVRGEIPGEEFALFDTLRALPEARYEVARVVTSGEDALMPLLWVRNAERDDFESAIANDSSVREFSLLSEFENALLYRMVWDSKVELILQMLTTSRATVMDMYGRGGQWHVRVLYPRPESLTRTREYVEEEDLTFSIAAIREMRGKPIGRYGLTEPQYEALKTGLEEGFFTIPRERGLKELADELDISHQALSERFRRGTAALVEDALVPGVPERASED